MYRTSESISIFCCQTLISSYDEIYSFSTHYWFVGIVAYAFPTKVFQLSNEFDPSTERDLNICNVIYSYQDCSWYHEVAPKNTCLMCISYVHRLIFSLQSHSLSSWLPLIKYSIYWTIWGHRSEQWHSSETRSHRCSRAVDSKGLNQFEADHKSVTFREGTHCSLLCNRRAECLRFRVWSFVPNQRVDGDDVIDSFRDANIREKWTIVNKIHTVIVFIISILTNATTEKLDIN